MMEKSIYIVTEGRGQGYDKKIENRRLGIYLYTKSSDHSPNYP